MEKCCKYCVYCNDETTEAEARWGIDDFECSMFFRRVSPYRDVCPYFELDYDKYYC